MRTVLCLFTGEKPTMLFFSSAMANVGMFTGVCVRLPRAMGEQTDAKAGIFPEV